MGTTLLPVVLQNINHQVRVEEDEWEKLFVRYPVVGDVILQDLDTESALACRLVCKAWRPFINTCRPLWAR